jgi:hypothetical protein
MKKILIFLVFLISLSGLAQNIKISALPSGSPVQDADAFVIARSGANYRISAANLKTYIGALTTYPGAGVANSTGSAWGTSYTVGTGANNLVQLNGSSQLPAVSAALLTNFPTFNQNTTGNASTATALATSRTINGTGFDGTSPITVPVNNVSDATNAAQPILFTPTQNGNFAARTLSTFNINPNSGAVAIPGGVTATSFTTPVSSAAGYLGFGQGTAPSLLTNTFYMFAPAAIATAFGWKMPAAAATGIVRGDASSTTVTVSQSELSGDVTTSGSNATTIANNAVTGAKMG